MTSLGRDTPAATEPQHDSSTGMRSKPDTESTAKHDHVAFGTWGLESTNNDGAKLGSDSMISTKPLRNKTNNREYAVQSSHIHTGAADEKMKRREKGSRHKRAASTNSQDNLRPHVQPNFIDPAGRNAQPNHPKQRAQSEEPLTELCRQRNRLYEYLLGEDPQRALEHDGIDMESTRSSRGRKPAHQHITDNAYIAENIADQDSSRTFGDEIADSQEDNLDAESVGIALSSERVTRRANTTRLTQHSSSVISADVPEAATHSSANRDAHNLENSDRNKEPPKPANSTWDDFALSVYDSYPGHSNGTLRVSKHSSVDMGKVPGGMKPMNRLRVPTPNPSIGPQRPSSFDLTGEHAFVADRSNKRQKIEDKAIIELDAETASGHNGPPTSKHSQSHTQHGQYRSQVLAGVAEHWNAEDTMRESGTRTRPVKNGDGNGARPLTSTVPSKPTAVKLPRMDDPSDPISDDDDHDDRDELAFSSAYSVKQHLPRTTPMVVIPHPPQKSGAGKKLGYQGTGDPSRARPLKNFETSAQPPAAETPKVSQHFPKTREKAPAVSLQRDPPIDQARRESIDELALNRHDWASSLVALKKKTQANDSGLQQYGSRQTPLIHGETSDEDDATQPADIKSTNFVPKRVERNNGDAMRMEVSIIVSQRAKWLRMPVHGKSWFLEHYVKAKVLSLVDGDHKSVWDLSTDYIYKIETHDESPILVLHHRVPSAEGAGFGGQIFVHFKDPNSCHLLKGDLKKSQPDLAFQKQSEKHLANTLKYQRAKPPPKKSQGQRIEVSQNVAAQNMQAQPRKDVTLAVMKQARKQEGISNAIQAQKAIRDSDAVSQLDHTNRAPKRQGLAQSMQSNTSTDEEGDSGLQTTNVYKSSNADRGPFYTTRSTRQVALKSSPPRRSPSPPWTQANPTWVADWKQSIIYPSEGKNQATVDKQDIERLDEGEFLNDNLVVFYLRWLENDLNEKQPEVAKRVYFIPNTFFYTKLTQNKGRQGINYEAVERWTSKVDLFQYDYIVVPVNEQTHWYVAIICHPSKMSPSTPLRTSPSQDEPRKSGEGKMSTEDISPPSLPELSTSPSDPVVSTNIRQLSLGEKKVEGNHDDSWPNNGFENESASRLFEDLATLPAGSEHEHDTSIKSLSPPLIVSDILPHQTPLKPAQIKGTKRSGLPTPKKNVDVNSFRIITFDSLGLPHSPTCINLKQYLMRELKAKKGIDIPDPGRVGMTAHSKIIPQQDNYCDCGLFMLNYVAKFLDNPDGFIAGIARAEQDLTTEWPTASKTREKIRDLLLELQKKQVKEAIILRQEKAKLKSRKNVKAESSIVAVPADISKPVWREATSSARTSPSPGEERLHPTDLPEPAMEHGDQNKLSRLNASTGLVSEDREPKTESAEYVRGGIRSRAKSLVPSVLRHIFSSRGNRDRELLSDAPQESSPANVQHNPTSPSMSFREPVLEMGTLTHHESLSQNQIFETKQEVSTPYSPIEIADTPEKPQQSQSIEIPDSYREDDLEDSPESAREAQITTTLKPNVRSREKTPFNHTIVPLDADDEYDHEIHGTGTLVDNDNRVEKSQVPLKGFPEDISLEEPASVPSDKASVPSDDDCKIIGSTSATDSVSKLRFGRRGLAVREDEEMLLTNGSSPSVSKDHFALCTGASHRSSEIGRTTISRFRERGPPSSPPRQLPTRSTPPLRTSISHGASPQSRKRKDAPVELDGSPLRKRTTKAPDTNPSPDGLVDGLLGNTSGHKASTKMGAFHTHFRH